MPEPRKTGNEDERPHGHRDRGTADEGPHKGESARPPGSHDPDAARIEAEETFQPDRDGTGR